MQLPVNLPGNIKDSLNKTAEWMLHELETNRLHVVLAPAPEQRFVGHCIRVAVEHNVWWWKQLYEDYKPKKLDKKGFKEALRRFIEDRKGQRPPMDKLVLETVRKLNQDPDVENYFKTAVKVEQT